jgi:transposase
VIDLRPIYHRTDDRMQAHIFVAALAFLLHRAIEKKLKATGLDLAATQALTALKSVRARPLFSCSWSRNSLTPLPVWSN